MIYVIAAIFCSASIALIFKFSETRGGNRYAVTAMNYLAAALISVGLTVQKGVDFILPESVTSAGGKIFMTILENERLTDPELGTVWSLALGSAAGLIFFLAFIAYQVSVNRHGASMSGAYAKIGILVPMLLSLLIWRRYPSAVQWTGITTAVAAMILVNIESLNVSRTRVKWPLLLLFLFGGIAEFSNKVFQNYGIQKQKPLFLLAVFGSAFVFSLVTMIMRQKKFHFTDLITGVAVGIPNLFSSFFLILGLESVPAGAAFPVFGAGTIAVVNIGGYVFFGERLNRREWTAMGMIMTALILVNM